MVLALGVAHSTQAARAQRQVTDMTNALLQKNAETLKMATIEAAKESERGIVDIFHRCVSYFCHSPFPTDSVELELLYESIVKTNLLNNDIVNGRVFYHAHLFLTVKDKSVELLVSEEMFHLPVFPFYIRHSFV